MIYGAKTLTRADIGQQRVRIRFAWLPRRLHDGRHIWLERYAALYEVRKCMKPGLLWYVIDWDHRGNYAMHELDRMPQPSDPLEIPPFLNWP